MPLSAWTGGLTACRLGRWRRQTNPNHSPRLPPHARRIRNTPAFHRFAVDSLTLHQASEEAVRGESYFCFRGALTLVFGRNGCRFTDDRQGWDWWCPTGWEGCTLKVARIYRSMRFYKVLLRSVDLNHCPSVQQSQYLLFYLCNLSMSS